MKKKFPFLVLFSALMISFTGSFFSIYGLGKLFGGHQIGATIIAFSFEFGNIITATALKIYWDYLNKLLKYSLVVVVACLTVITSTGIYGYLSDGYQKTALLDEVVNKRSNLVSIKKNSFETRIQDNKREIESINTSVQELSKGFNQNTQTQQVVKGQVVTNVIVGNKKGLESQMNNLSRRKYVLDSLNTMYLDSVQNLEIQIIELQSNNEAASELGPLKFMSDLSGTPMNKIVNWLILVIVIIFQPLAIMLLVTAMYAFENNDRILDIENTPVKQGRKKKESPKKEEEQPPKKSFIDSITDSIKSNEVIGKAKKLKETVLSFNMDNLKKELNVDPYNITQSDTVESLFDSADTPVVDETISVKPKRKYTKKPKPEIEMIPETFDDNDINPSIFPDVLEVGEDVGETSKELNSAPDEKKSSDSRRRKRKVVDTELNAQIADHILNSLQNKKKG